MNNELTGQVISLPRTLEGIMIYQFKCKTHGKFEVKQSIFDEHEADCPKCKQPAQRIYSNLQWIWNNTAYRPDGSLRQDKDYAPVMKG